MNVVIDGENMTVAADRIDVAVRDLALTCQRIESVLGMLKAESALTSPGIDEKYGDLARKTVLIGKEIERYQKVMSKLSKNFIAQVDQIDKFLY